MNILAIDTASSYLSLALSTSSNQYSFLEVVDNQQSKFIIPKIQYLLQQASITHQDLDLITYNQGPGSFTGLRIGLGVAIGLAIGLDIELLPIPAFAIYANAVKEQVNGDSVIVGLDARMSEVYLATINTKTFAYDKEPMVIKPAAITNPNNLPICGNGFTVYNKELNPKLPTLTPLAIDTEYPNTINMLHITKQQIFTPVKPEQAQLMYIRNKVALTINERAKNKHQISA